MIIHKSVIFSILTFALAFITAIVLPGCADADKAANWIVNATAPATQPSPPTIGQATVRKVEAASAAAGAFGVPYTSLVPDVIGLASLLAAGYLKVRNSRQGNTIGNLQDGLTTIAQAAQISSQVVAQLHPDVAHLVIAANPAAATTPAIDNAQAA